MKRAFACNVVLTLVAVSLGMVSALHGATWDNSVGDSDINNALNWGGTLPRDSAATGAVVTSVPLVINKAFKNGDDNRAEYLITGPGGVTIADGGSFTYSGDGLFGSSLEGRASTIIQTGGTLTQDGGGTGLLIGHNAVGTYNISGGKLYVQGRAPALVIDYSTSDGSSLNISGTGRVDVEAGVALVINDGGTLNVSEDGLLVWHNRTVAEAIFDGTVNAQIKQVGTDVHFTLIPPRKPGLYDLNAFDRTTTSVTLAAILVGGDADVTAYWTEGVVRDPASHTGWDNTSDPVTTKEGPFQSAITQLKANTLYSYTFHATNSARSYSAWSPVKTFTTSERETRIGNGKVAVDIQRSGGRVKLTFEAKNSEGGWSAVCQTFSPDFKRNPKGNRLFDTTVIPYRYQTSDMDADFTVSTNEGEQTVIKIKGACAGATIEQTVSLRPGDPYFHVEVRAHLEGTPAKLEYLMSSFTFNLDKAPSFVHTPSLKDSADDIIGDGVFYAPAVILQEGGLFAALVPDLDMINQYQVLSPDARRTRLVAGNPKFTIEPVEKFMTMPTGLDLNIKTGLTQQPVFSFGFIDSLAAHHVRWRHPNDGSMVRTLGKNEVRYGFDLFVEADAPPATGFQQVSRHQWRRYGHATLQQPRPQAMPMMEYARLVYANQFKPLGAYQPPVQGYKDTGSFLEFEMNGEPVGGYRNAAPFWLDVLCNGLWWNNMSDAVGFYYWGKRLDKPDLLDKARRTVNLAMQAPQNHGLFPVIYNAAEKRWVGNHFDPPMKQPTFAGKFEDAGGYVSGGYTHVSPNHFQVNKGWDSRSYLVAACSRTGVHLLQYHTQCEPDERIVPYLKRYADYLLTQIDEKGTVPAWITYDLKPHWILRDSAHNAASMWFFAELYKTTREQKYLDGAEKIAAFMNREILPRMDWKDLEHYFSCGMKPLWYKQDEWQAQPTRGVLSQIWAMYGFKALYEASGKEQYLLAGESVVDYFSLSQTCWAPHFKFTAYTFGGCDTDNGDAAWLNGHQSQTVEPLIWYGLQLGRQDLLERGVAAAHASVVLVRSERHIKNEIWPYPNNHPIEGLGPENVDHEGFASDCMRTSPGLGEGNGVNTAMPAALRLLGGAYIDVKKNLAVGVNGIRIDKVSLNQGKLKIKAKGLMSELPLPWDRPYSTDLRIVGLPDDGDFELTINDAEPMKLSAQNLASLPIVVNPDGTIVISKKSP